MHSFISFIVPAKFVTTVRDDCRLTKVRDDVDDDDDDDDDDDEDDDDRDRTTIGDADAEGDDDDDRAAFNRG